MRMKIEKAFDCVGFKHEVQQRIYEATKDMSHAELLAYLRESVERGPFAAWWHAVPPVGQAHTAERG